MPNEPATEALTAYAALIAGVTFPTITDEVTGADFNLPAQSGILYDAPVAVDIDTLTDTTVGGAGVFDKIMTSLRAHLSEEYDKGRITGSDYARAYHEMTAAALGNAVQFALSANTSAYQNALIQMQARGAEADALSARANLIRAKYAVVSAIAESETMKANYALAKINIGVQDITYTSIESQVAKTDYEVATLMVKQAAVLDEDIRIKTFQRDNLMPAQENVLKEQHEVQRAQTMDVRSDNITTIEGAIGKQKDLYDEQISSYQKDARFKSAKLWVDGWITQKSLDEGLLAPNQFTNTEIDEVLQSLKTDLSLGTV